MKTKGLDLPRYHSNSAIGVSVDHHRTLGAVTGAPESTYSHNGTQSIDSQATFGHVRCEGLSASGPPFLPARVRLLLLFDVFQFISILPRFKLGVNDARATARSATATDPNAVAMAPLAGRGGQTLGLT